MLRVRAGHCFGLFLPQARAVFGVCEEEGDGAGGDGHHKISNELSFLLVFPASHQLSQRLV